MLIGKVPSSDVTKISIFVIHYLTNAFNINSPITRFVHFYKFGFDNGSNLPLNQFEHIVFTILVWFYNLIKVETSCFLGRFNTVFK